MSRDLARYRAALHSSAADYDHTGHLATMPTALAWTSAGGGEEWLQIDLGALSSIEGVTVTWGEERAKRFALLFSADGESWTRLADCAAAERRTETSVAVSARFVKLLCLEPEGDRYTVERVEVWGENALDYTLPHLPPEAEGRQLLSGGAWRLCRAEEVSAAGERLSLPDYDDGDWLPATVPGTVLTSYLNAGAVPDPNYDDWQFQVSEAYFTADFWYRDRVTVPAAWRRQRVFLRFEAVNWKAEVYFNGVRLENPLPHRKSSIEGAFIRAAFDVTELARFGEENGLAVLVHKNANPGAVTTQGLAFGPGNNGGLLGADNPTLHASVGWDWLPTIRGRNIGLYGEVSLTYGGDAELLDPWMKTELRLLEEETANPAEDLAKDGALNVALPWRGREGEGFTLDLGAPQALGAVLLRWGREAGGAAADADSRHPERFALEASQDGEAWTPLDFYPGGEVTLPWFGAMKGEANPGTPAFTGHPGSDSVQGGTAIVPLDLTPFGGGPERCPVFAPQEARYLRFTVLERRRLNGSPVDTLVDALELYRESPEQLEQGKLHRYRLDTAQAALRFETELRNHGEKPLAVTLRGRVEPGGPAFEEALTLAPGETRPLALPLCLESPRLWWPNTYGEPFLYTAEAELWTGDTLSDRKRFRFGVRRLDTPVDGGLMSLYCNGARILAKGGNWGMDDGLKRDDARTLRDKVRLHALANLTMIRNWVGMTGHPAFYEACDEYGVLIWDDFWLANPVDGPEPEDPALFLENAEDKLRRVRRHPALALYCGRNEGNPNPVIDAGLRELTARLDGTRPYIPNSAAAPVGSGGGYSLAAPGGDKGVKQYFNDVSSAALRSERGIPNVPAPESLRRFLKPEHLWPINEVWALHDWTYHMNVPANTYMAALQSLLGGDFPIPVDRIRESEPRPEDPVYLRYKGEIAAMCAAAGKAWRFEDFARAAQRINYENHRGLFEALAARRTNGLLMWMSQSSWPSFMWQTYDYFLDTNGGYFGVMAGNQPTRALFDPRDDGLLLANASAARYENVSTEAEVFDLWGRPVSRRVYTTPLLEPDACGLRLGRADFSASPTDLVFLRLTLRDEGGAVLGRNTYWHNRRDYQDYRALAELAEPAASLKVLGEERTEDELRWTLRVTNGPTPALCLRLRLMDRAGEPLLPVFWSDNYLTLMPGEEREITAAVHGEGWTMDNVQWIMDN